MTLKELAIELDRLILEGNGSRPVYFNHASMSLPVSRVLTDKIVNIDVIILKY